MESLRKAAPAFVVSCLSVLILSGLAACAPAGQGGHGDPPAEPAESAGAH